MTISFEVHKSSVQQPVTECPLQPLRTFSPYKLFFLLATCLVALFSATPSALAQTSSTIAPIEIDLFHAVNAARSDYGLPALRWDDRLYTLAQYQGNLIATSGLFSHSIYGATFTRRINDVGYRFSAAGENLALSDGPIDATQVVEMWLASPSHRNNLLNPNFSEVALAAHQGDLMAFVSEFASPL